MRSPEAVATLTGAAILIGAPITQKGPVMTSLSRSPVTHRPHSLSGPIALFAFLLLLDGWTPGQEREGKAYPQETQNKGRGSRPQEEIAQVLEDLERGMRALRTLQRNEELEMLERVAADVKQDFARRRGRDSGADEERDAARKQIGVLRLAMKVYADEGRPDSAELLEHKIRAMELSLEGKRGEAREHQSKAPDRPQTVELLNFAAHLARERGHEEKAEVMAQLARHLLPPSERVSTPEREIREHDAGLEDRIARLERQIERLANAIERLQDERREPRERKQ
jgi:hypothetical protein